MEFVESLVENEDERESLESLGKGESERCGEGEDREKDGSNGHHDGKGKAKGKLRRSCEGCRRFKVRCLVEEGGEDVCQKCLKSGKKCVFLEGKRRPKKAREARLRVEEMEQKIESLMAIVTSGIQASAAPSQELTLATIPSSAPSAPEISISSPLPYSTAPQFQCPRKASRSFQPFGNLAFPISANLPFSIFDDFQDVVSRGVVSYEKAEQSLRHFRTTASSFPFVVIPPSISLDHLRRNKPFLLLTILAMAANDNMKAQKILDQELRENIGRRVFVSGERSLDLLQGILIYLTWHHFFFEPDHQQIYQLCQSAISMAVDLEITRPEQQRRHNPSNSFNLLSLIAESNSLANSIPSQNPEAMRAFLGCYYLSSTLCIGLRKPNNLKYTNYTEECCQFFTTTREFESDCLIPYFVQLQKLADDINRTFDYDGHQEVTSLDPLRIEMFVGRFKKQLNQLEKSFPAEVWKHDMLIMAHYHLQTFINEIGFHKTSPSFSSHDLQPQSTSDQWCSSITRSEILLNCLQTTKEYLERYISLSPDTLFTCTFPDYAKLVYNVLVLKLFAKWRRDDDISVDSAQIQKNANMAFYMEALVRKFENLGKIGKERGLVEDYTIYLVKLFQTYEGRAKFYEVKAREEMELESNGFPGNCGVDLSILQALPRFPTFEAQLDASNVDGQEPHNGNENTEEQWDDMINAWSPGLDMQELSTETLFT